MFNLRRKEIPWEVVDSEIVEPIPVYYDEEDLHITNVSAVDTRGTYVFVVKNTRPSLDLHNSVVFARQQLMLEIAKRGHNVLLRESWSVTVYRRAKEHRVEVQYSGRPALALGTVPSHRSPPFISVLQART